MNENQDQETEEGEKGDDSHIVAALCSKAREEIEQDLGTRSTWEDKQRIWYKMRHGGLGRTNRQPWQADLHVPLADSQIDKLKPYYYQQTFNGERLTDFSAERSDLKEYAESNSAWFDFNLKERSNFEREVMHNIDSMTQNGCSVIKKGWDLKAKKLTYEQIDPAFIIVPSNTKSLDCADRITHVIQLSEEEYRRNPNYDHSEEVVKAIFSGGDSSEDSDVEEDKKSREGITHSEQKGIGVIWEHWRRAREADGSIRDEWIVLTFPPKSPSKPCRPPFSPNLGHDEDHVFIDFPIEIKDKGYYSSRGICERLAPYEAYATKVWNEKADYLSFINKPIFEHDKDAIQVNTANITVRPGSLMKPGIKLSDRKALPPDIQMEMEYTKQTAEELIMSPNFGIEQQGGDNRTATELNYIGQVSGQGQDLRARVYRSSLSRLYRLSWKTLVKLAKSEAIEYYDATVEDFKQVDPQGIEDAFKIEPAGTPEIWNKQQQQQRAMGRFQLLKGDPFIDQLELRKDLIGSEDPRDVVRLVIDPNVRAKDEIEEQAQEISVMLIGFDAPVKPDDDDMVHCESIIGWITQYAIRNQGIEPSVLQLIIGHYMGHVEALKQKKEPDLAKQALEAIQATMQEAAAFHQQNAEQEALA